MLGKPLWTSISLQHRGVYKYQPASRAGISYCPLTTASTWDKTIQQGFKRKQSSEQMEGGGARRAQFLDKVRNHAHSCRTYEDRSVQDAALKTVNVSELEEKALIALAKEGKMDVSEHELDHAKLLQLLLWFKSSFTWVDQPPCGKCRGESYYIGNVSPNQDERKFQAGRVELFRCKSCGSEVRFPRYDDPRKLLETRRGRCGEWANCFTLYCRALGYRARLILAFIDHVWTECYFPELGRWVHTDPCEGVLDKPLLYEQGWKKNLNYIIAFSHDGIRDVTKRYTRKWPEILTRRTLLSEEEEEEVIAMLNMQQRANVSSQEWDELVALDAQEDDEIIKSYRAGAPSEGPMIGRQTGSEEWRLARGEIQKLEVGNSVNAQKSTSAKGENPVRLCLDEHVALVREALGSLWSDMTGSDPSVEKVVLGMKGLCSYLEELKWQPFRTRKLKLDPQTEKAWLHYASDETVSLLLQALSLLPSPGEDGELWVGVEGNPVHTALALPVALELLERLVKDLPSEVTVKWLMHGSRLCKGIARASGEEDPVGIASTAFDGLHSTKWEEPAGGKSGAWIMYQLPDGDRPTLAAYELTSANDWPSRDPCVWILEGSDDNGRSWRSLDSQRGQLFEERFLSKTYEIAKENRFPCDSFRLRVLSTQDRAKDDRLQIACIDLIASKV